MSKSTKTNAAKPKDKRDRYDVFVVDKYTDNQNQDRSNWTRLGVAFPHGDGKGLNIELLALPVNGKLVVRLHEDKPEEQ